MIFLLLLRNYVFLINFSSKSSLYTQLLGYYFMQYVHNLVGILFHALLVEKCIVYML